MGFVWLVWRYLWRIFINALEIVVLWGILIGLHARFEVIVVSILGLLYATIRGVGNGLRYALIALTTALDADFRRIRSY